MGQTSGQNAAQGKRVGIIGLDTSHSIAFTKSLNAENADDSFLGYKVVAAYPQGSLDIPSSVERIEGYTKQIQEMGVEIFQSIEEMLAKVDVVLLETNDGRRHLEQALPVLKAGKRMFIDKPMTASRRKQWRFLMPLHFMVLLSFQHHHFAIFRAWMKC